MAASSPAPLITIDTLIIATTIIAVGYLVYRAIMYEIKPVPNDGLDEPHSNVGERGSWDMEDWNIEKKAPVKKK